MNEIKVLESIEAVQEFRKSKKQIGFVPTMGALHAGHQSLIEQSAQENQTTIVSIYVNPTQFNNADDFQKYPKTWNEDLKLAAAAGANAVFAPKYEQMYPDQYRYKVTESEFSKILCGAHRPGHFDGVLSVVMKLFNIIQPDRAYFGEKDFQQLRLIEGMVQAYFMDVEIKRCPTLRESSGLAMSSRNTRLSAAGNEKAALIYKAIKNEKSASAAKTVLIQNGFEVDYVEDIDNRRFVAAVLEGVRLIDNIEIAI